LTFLKRLHTILLEFTFSHNNDEVFCVVIEDAALQGRRRSVSPPRRRTSCNNVDYTHKLECMLLFKARLSALLLRNFEVSNNDGGTHVVQTRQMDTIDYDCLKTLGKVLGRHLRSQTCRHSSQSFELCEVFVPSTLKTFGMRVHLVKRTRKAA